MKKIHLIAFALTISVKTSALSQPEIDSGKYYSHKAQQFRFVSVDSMQFYAFKANEYTQRSGDLRGSLHFHGIMGVSLEEQGLYGEALLHFDSAMNLANQLGDSVEIARVFHHYGVLYKERSLWDQSVEYLTKAILVAEKFDAKDISSLGSMNLGMVYSLMGKHDLAKRYAWQAYRISEFDEELVKTRIGSLVEIGRSYFNTMTLDSSVWAFEKARALLDNEKSKDGLSVIVNNLGVIYYFQGKYDEAIANFARSVEIAKETNDQKGVALGLMNIGDTYTTKGNFDLANDYLNQSLAIFKSIRHLNFIRQNYEYLAGMATASNQWKKALDYTNLMHTYKDSILNETTTAKIAELQTQYETAKKEQEIATLKAEAEVKELQIAQTRTLVVAVSVIAFLIVLGLIVVGRQRRQKLLAQMTLEKEQLKKERFSVVIAAEENERKRMARDLHDGLGQMLSTVRLFVSDLDDPKKNPKVERSLTALDATIQEVRTISHNMMPLQLLDLGLKDALESMAARVSTSDRLKMNVEMDASIAVSENEAIALYRSIQEVVNNAIKYAHASTIGVQLTQHDGLLHTVVKDDGQGFNTELIAKSKGIGWSNIYARMEMIGGEVDVASRKGDGTQVTLSLPLTGSVAQRPTG